MTTYSSATSSFIHRNSGGWAELNFFQAGTATRLAASLDEMAAEGCDIYPPPHDLYRAFELTPLQSVRVVIVGQDPYPQEGNAHGLAFSVPRGKKIPASLRTIFDAYEADTGLSRPNHGDLSRWAQNGVLLLNYSLTVLSGAPNSHKSLGWAELVGEVLGTVSNGATPVIFMAWGGFAQQLFAKFLPNVGSNLLIECSHPSPLARASVPGGSTHPFISARPFARANTWLRERGLEQVDWDLSYA